MIKKDLKKNLGTEETYLNVGLFLSFLYRVDIPLCEIHISLRHGVIFLWPTSF